MASIKESNLTTLITFSRVCYGKFSKIKIRRNLAFIKIFNVVARLNENGFFISSLKELLSSTWMF